MADEEAVTRRKKPNSPKAPGLSLRAAMAEVSKAYLRYSHGAFTRGELASALSMSAGSGSFLTKIAALRDYGLVDESHGELRVSDLFKTLYQAPGGSAEMKRNALAAVQHASVFARLLQQFGSRVPDEPALALRLENQDRFNRDRAAVVAAAFRSSLSDYGLIDGSGNVLSVRDEAPPSSAEDQSIEPSSSEDGIGDTSGSARFRLEVPLGNGRRAAIMLPEDLTASDVQRITAVLHAYVE